MLILLAWQTLLPGLILWRSKHLQVYADKRARRWVEGLECRSRNGIRVGSSNQEQEYCQEQSRLSEQNKMSDDGINIVRIDVRKVEKKMKSRCNFMKL
jgi:hypothetical protein